MAILEFLNGPAAGRTLHLPDRGLSVFGSEDDVDFPLNFEKISRRHFAIEATPQGYMLTDLASKNGTYVNEQAITAHALRSGEVIRVGAVEIKFRQEEETVYSSPSEGAEAIPVDDAAVVHHCETCGNEITLGMLSKGVAQRVASVILCGSCVRRTEALNLQGVIAVEELRRLLGLPEPSDEDIRRRTRRHSRRTRRHSRVKRFGDD